MAKTPYEILGVTSTASAEDIRNAYRNLAKKFHPDLNPGKKDAEKQFKEINSANELIGSPAERAKYDQGENDLRQPRPPPSGTAGRSGPFYHQTQQDGGRYSSSFEGMDDDVFQSIFGRMGGRTEGNARGEDALYRMDISFKDAVLGAEREITLPNGKNLRVKIPAGVDTGTRLRFAGQGSASQGKATAGDAYVELNVKPSELFTRDNNNLEIELPVSMSEAILGAEIKSPTIDGWVLLKVPPLVNSGQRLRVPGKGVPIGTTGKRGDQFVVLKVLAPSSVDDEMKQAIADWTKRQPFEPRAGWIGEKGETS